MPNVSQRACSILMGSSLIFASKSFWDMIELPPSSPKCPGKIQAKKVRTVAAMTRGEGTPDISAAAPPLANMRHSAGIIRATLRWLLLLLTADHAVQGRAV